MTASAMMPEDKINYQIRCDPDWLGRVERAAAKLGLSKTAYIRMVVTQRMDADEVPVEDPAKGKRKKE